jgi:hypothetical protein
MENIEEGLVFFKESRRLLNMTRTIRKRAIKNGSYNGDVDEYIESLEELAKRFAELEDEYDHGSAALATTRYEKLKVQSKQLLAKLNKETLRKGLIGATIGGTALMLGKILLGLATNKAVSETTLSDLQGSINEEAYDILSLLKKDDN